MSLILGNVEMYLRARGLDTIRDGAYRGVKVLKGRDADPALLTASVDRLIVVTRGGGSGFLIEPDPTNHMPGKPSLQGGLYDRVLLSVRVVGSQANYDDGQRFADDVDGLLLADSNVAVGSQQALYVTRAGGSPTHMMTDTARRAHFVCSYVLPVARVASGV